MQHTGTERLQVQPHCMGKVIWELCKGLKFDNTDKLFLHKPKNCPKKYEPRDSLGL